jgi:hypothetical protein
MILLIHTLAGIVALIAGAASTQPPAPTQPPALVGPEWTVAYEGDLNGDGAR